MCQLETKMLRGGLNNMKLYVVYYDGYLESWGSEIYILGIYDSEEKAEQAIERDCGCYLYEIKEIELNKDGQEYLGGYFE